MSDRAPYSRVYWSINDDPKFDGIRDDRGLVGAWLLMLIAADQAYPSPAYLLPHIPRSAVQRLVDAGLVERLDGHRFRLVGLQAERERRKQLATTRGPSGDRPVTVRSLSGDLAKPSHSQDETSLVHTEARDPADIYWQLTGRYPADRALAWIDSLIEDYGSEPVIGALAKCHLEDRSTQTLLSRTRDLLAAGARHLSKKEQEAEKQRVAEKRENRVEEPQLTEAEIQALADAYREDHAA